MTDYIADCCKLYRDLLFYTMHCQIILYHNCAGVLCGDCRNGYGVSVLLNKCVTCHDASGLLIVVLSKLQI